MKKHIAHLLRRAANRIDPPKAAVFWGPSTGKTSANGNYRLTFLR